MYSYITWNISSFSDSCWSASNVVEHSRSCHVILSTWIILNGPGTPQSSPAVVWCKLRTISYWITGIRERSVGWSRSTKKRIPPHIVPPPQSGTWSNFWILDWPGNEIHIVVIYIIILITGDPSKLMEIANTYWNILWIIRKYNPTYINWGYIFYGYQQS